VTASAQPSPLPKSNASASLLANVLVNTYVDHLPLNRQEMRYARRGVHLPRATPAVHGSGAHRPVGDIYRPRERRAHSYKFWSCMGLDKHADSFVYAALDFRGDMTK
jgi:transposase